MRERYILMMILTVTLAACGGRGETTAKQAAGGDPQRGFAAIQQRGCGGCHTIPGIPNATGMMGPSLAGVSERMGGGEPAANQPDKLTLWIMDPQKIAPGTSMPDLGIEESEARDIAAYLHSMRN